MRRLLVPHAEAGLITVDGPRFGYLTRVLRMREGDALELFDGTGGLFDAVVTKVNSSTLELNAGNPRQAPLSRHITVVQGIPKADKLELVLQKATELGASAFAPVACERCVVKLEGKEEAKRTRWQRIVEEAARQCGRADIPQVLRSGPLAAVVGQLPHKPLVLVLDEEERSMPLSVATGEVGERALALVVGPEGGLTREEVASLVAAGATAVTLGRLVLRTETAALAALAVLRHLDGHLG